MHCIALQPFPLGNRRKRFQVHKPFISTNLIIIIAKTFGNIEGHLHRKMGPLDHSLAQLNSDPLINRVLVETTIHWWINLQ